MNKRLLEHNNQPNQKKFTAKYIPWEIKLYFPVSDIRGEAIRVEKFIKTQKNKLFILRLIENKDNPEFFIHLINHVLEQR